MVHIRVVDGIAVSRAPICRAWIVKLLFVPGVRIRQARDENIGSYCRAVSFGFRSPVTVEVGLFSAKIPNCGRYPRPQLRNFKGTIRERRRSP